MNKPKKDNLNLFWTKKFIKDEIPELLKMIDKARIEAGSLKIAYKELGDTENHMKLELTHKILEELEKPISKIATDILVFESLDTAKVDSK